MEPRDTSTCPVWAHPGGASGFEYLPRAHPGAFFLSPRSTGCTAAGGARQAQSGRRPPSVSVPPASGGGRDRPALWHGLGQQARHGHGHGRAARDMEERVRSAQVAWRRPRGAHAASARAAGRRDGAPRNRSVGGAGDTLPCNRSLLPGFSFNFAGWLWPFPKNFKIFRHRILEHMHETLNII